jgi:hypothetical protein
MNFEDFEREFSSSEKLKAFLYHLYMVTFAMILEPEKHKNYVETFDEFIEYRKQQQN